MTYQAEQMAKVGLSFKNTLPSVHENSDLGTDSMKISGREGDMRKISLSLTVGSQ